MSLIWKISIGDTVQINENLYEVINYLDDKSLMGKNLKTGLLEKLLILELTQPSQKNTNKNEKKIEYHLDDIPDKLWDEANRRAEHVERLLSLPRTTAAAVQREADSLGVCRTTMYSYIKLYEPSRKVSSLIPQASDGGRNKPRTDEASEAILKVTIEEYYLTEQNRKVQKVIREYERRCSNAGVKSVHPNTVRNRINQIEDKIKIAKRQGRKAADSYSPSPGKFPEGNFPLEVVQIDHTLVDLEFVDDESRLPIGRLWLTVMIDIFSRMILGFYLSVNSPSVHSVGMCIAHSVLTKESELKRLGVGGEWNNWGLINKIHADNGSDFRAKDLKRACQEYGIDIEWRPVGRPNFGAHIESLLGTFMSEVHELPGTTFSNVQKKGNYDSEKKAVFTDVEFERWLTTYITGYYHKKEHSGIGMPPEIKYQQGLFIGSEEYGPTGPPPRIMDERKFRLDFLPSESRVVHDYGVKINHIKYYDSVLNPFIGTKDPEYPKYSRKLTFKYNPRNLEKVYFYHPDAKQYFEIPYRNLSNPALTAWELKVVKQKLKDAGIKIESENQIFKTLNEMRRLEESSVDKTKSARRKKQSQRIYDEQNKRHGFTNAAIPEKESKNKDKTKTTISEKYADFLNLKDDEIKPLKVKKM